MSAAEPEAAPKADRGITVNFLDFTQKTPDFRFRTHQSMGLNRTSRTVYWTGILDLRGLDPNKMIAPLSFVSKIGSGIRVIKDFYEKREVDGKGTGPTKECSYSFDMPELKEELLRAKECGNVFAYVLIEEVVYPAGNHTVSLLYRQAPQKYRFCVPSKVSLEYAPLHVVHDLYALKVDDSTESICILSNGCYNWMK